MKFAFICSSDILAFPAVKYLYEQGLLASVAVPSKLSDFLMQALKHYSIPLELCTVLTKGNLLKQLQDSITRDAVEAVFVLSCPFKIPEEVLSLPQYGFYNFHPGLLPEYKGADPVFWQIRNREKRAGFTIHKMTAEIDEGPVILKEEISLIPGETYGLYLQRLGTHVPHLIDKLINQLQHTPVIKQAVGLITGSSAYFKRPDKEQLTINWQEHTAEEIEALINAANPNYGGAITTLRQVEVRVLEVAPVDFENAPETAPGTIVYADTLYGLIVACINHQFLRINIIHTAQGYMSGGKLFNLGFRVGESFSNFN